jgi:hypothetical protein
MRAESSWGAADLLHAATEAMAHAMRRKTAALRYFSPLYVRLGSWLCENAKAAVGLLGKINEFGTVRGGNRPQATDSLLTGASSGRFAQVLLDQPVRRMPGPVWNSGQGMPASLPGAVAHQ